MSQKIVIDIEECLGCGTCSELCPDVFGFDQDEEKAFVIKPEATEEECVEEAISSCPAECISIE